MPNSNIDQIYHALRIKFGFNQWQFCWKSTENEERCTHTRKAINKKNQTTLCQMNNQIFLKWHRSLHCGSITPCASIHSCEHRLEFFTHHILLSSDLKKSLSSNPILLLLDSHFFVSMFIFLDLSFLKINMVEEENQFDCEIVSCVFQLFF